MDVKKWFSETSRSHVTDTVIADILNVTRKTANKRVNEGMSADDLITISNALKINPVIALVEFDRIDHNDVADFLDSDGQLIATAEPGHLALELARKLNPATFAPELDELAARRSNKSTPAVQPISDDDLAAAIREANAQPRAAHPADDTEYTEPESP
ncbi:hypothetical protein [Corynebacterium glutamicum]|uniref:hypothetical protein n=1 Tax=Corynebacterium glutamicum TaxID=1718 RepID=UPI000744AD38|nr:hypothetical protein [Corynebacterium glutamicum]AMA01563.1 hypothetical protein APT58_08430 [Corynebacterium glutamicum]